MAAGTFTTRGSYEVSCAAGSDLISIKAAGNVAIAAGSGVSVSANDVDVAGDQTASVSAGVNLTLEAARSAALTAGTEVQITGTKAAVKTMSDQAIQTGGEFHVKSARNIVLKGARILQN